LRSDHQTEDLGLRAYALYSEACVLAMAVDAQAQGLVPHAESINHAVSGKDSPLSMTIRPPESTRIA
jgi:hypothetical protein